jgi:hypothetical protein
MPALYRTFGSVNLKSLRLTRDESPPRSNPSLQFAAPLVFDPSCAVESTEGSIDFELSVGALGSVNLKVAGRPVSVAKKA